MCQLKTQIRVFDAGGSGALYKAKGPTLLHNEHKDSIIPLDLYCFESCHAHLYHGGKTQIIVELISALVHINLLEHF